MTTPVANNKMKNNTFDNHFSKILNKTIETTCNDLGFNKEQRMRFKKQFLNNMLLIAQLTKLKLKEAQNDR